MSGMVKAKRLALLLLLVAAAMLAVGCEKGEKADIRKANIKDKDGEAQYSVEVDDGMRIILYGEKDKELQDGKMQFLIQEKGETNYLGNFDHFNQSDIKSQYESIKTIDAFTTPAFTARTTWLDGQEYPILLIAVPGKENTWFNIMCDDESVDIAKAVIEKITITDQNTGRVITAATEGNGKESSSGDRESTNQKSSKGKKKKSTKTKQTCEQELRTAFKNRKIAKSDDSISITRNKGESTFVVRIDLKDEQPNRIEYSYYEYSFSVKKAVNFEKSLDAANEEIAVVNKTLKQLSCMKGMAFATSLGKMPADMTDEVAGKCDHKIASKAREGSDGKGKYKVSCILDDFGISFDFAVERT